MNKDKLPFMATVIGHLIFQGFMVYQGVEAALKNSEVSEFTEKNRLLLIISSIALMLTLILANLGIKSKFILFTSVSLITGLLYHRVRDLREALLEAVAIFISMIIAGFISVQLGLNLRTMGTVLFFALLALLIARLFRPGDKNLTKIGILIFALFVLYDTNQILQRNYNGDFIDASVDYFTDIINLLAFSSEE
jgi:FtsH-binding integral membrane protein